MDDPNFWKEFCDFIKNVISDTIAPWVNSYLVSPTVAFIRPHIPKATRFVGRQLASVRDALIDLCRFWCRNRIAQVGSVFVVAGLALGETPAAQWGPIVVGPPVMLYLCWGFVDGLQRRVRTIFNSLW